MAVKTILDIHATIRRLRLELEELIEVSDNKAGDYPIHPSAREIRAALRDLDALRASLVDGLPSGGREVRVAVDSSKAEMDAVVDNLSKVLSLPGQAWWKRLTPQEQAEWITWWAENGHLSQPFSQGGAEE